MLILLIRLLVISDEPLVVFWLLFLFWCFNDALHLCSVWFMWGAQSVSAVWGSSEDFFCLYHLALLFRDWIAAQYCRDGWDENGFDRDKKGGSFWFLLYVTNIIVLLKKHRIFFQHLCYLTPNMGRMGWLGKWRIMCKWLGFNISQLVLNVT